MYMKNSVVILYDDTPVSSGSSGGKEKFNKMGAYAVHCIP
jgi:hypothetical protein